MQEQIPLHTNESDSFSEKLRRLKVLFPASLSMFLAGCLNSPDQSELIKKAAELYPHQIEKVDTSSLREMRGVLHTFKNNEFSREGSVYAVRLGDTLRLQKEVFGDSKKNTEIFDYVFDGDTKTTIIWSSGNGNAGNEFQHMLGNDEEITATGEMEIDDMTGVVTNFIGDEGAYRIQTEDPFVSPKPKPEGSKKPVYVFTSVHYEKGMAEEFFQNRMKDIDALKQIKQK